MVSSFSTEADALIVGGDGMVGSRLATHLRGRGMKVHATTRHLAAVDPLRPFVDLESGHWSALAGVRYRTAFLCAAQARLAQCRLDPEGSARVNVRGCVSLANWLADQGTRVVFLSTNQVFDGSRAPRLPTEPVCPVTEYGRQKAAAESAILTLPDAAVLRLTKVIHPGLPLFERWMTDLRGGKPITPFSDLGLAPVTAGGVVRCLEGIADVADAAGIWQLSAPEDITYTDAGRYIAERLKVDRSLVVPVSGQAALAMGGDPPARWSALDTARVRSVLGLVPLTALDAIESCLALGGVEG